MSHRGLSPIIVYSNDDIGLTMTYFTARSNFVTQAFLQEKSEKKWIFSRTIAACDLKVGGCRQIIEFMKVFEY